MTLSGRRQEENKHMMDGQFKWTVKANITLTISWKPKTKFKLTAKWDAYVNFQKGISISRTTCSLYVIQRASSSLVSLSKRKLKSHRATKTMEMMLKAMSRLIYHPCLLEQELTSQNHWKAARTGTIQRRPIAQQWRSSSIHQSTNRRPPMRRLALQ